MDNNTVPPIAFGTGGSSFKNPNLLKNGLKEYINIGGRIIDSAEKYNSGVIIKEFIKVDRNAFYIISKIRAHQHPQSEIENVIKNKILKDLNTNYLDELVIHSACEEKYRQHRINTWLEFKKLKLPKDDPMRRKPVIDLAIKKLNWEPKISLDLGLDRTIDYFLNKLK